MLDKDNDLDVTALALVNAADIVRVQPEGPYLVGGHSYGGTGEQTLGWRFTGDVGAQFIGNMVSDDGVPLWFRLPH